MFFGVVGQLVPAAHISRKGKIFSIKEVMTMSNDVQTPPDDHSLQIWGMNLNTYCMLLHLSQFCQAICPGLGLIAPIVLWVVNKDKSALIDTHGKVILNWIISLVIYTTVLGLMMFTSLLLTAVFIGFVLIIPVTLAGLALVAAAMAFPIVGAIKANEGIVWLYPLCIPFFKVDLPDTSGNVVPANTSTF